LADVLGELDHGLDAVARLLGAGFQKTKKLVFLTE